MGRESGSKQRGDQGSQIILNSPGEQAEVVASSGEDSVGAVDVATLGMVAVHAVLGLEAADSGLLGGGLDMIGQSQSQRHNRQGWISEAARGEDRTSGDIEVGNAVNPAIGVDHTILRGRRHTGRSHVVITGG